MTTERSALMDRTLILASAGSGKTWQLSSRLIGLLASGAPPESILASTFTRKAAGEILERVLERLARAALSEAEAAILGDSLPEGSFEGPFRAADAARLLETVVASLHRLQVFTLDAFMYRVVRTFGPELGLPEGWALADEVEEDRIRARALETVFSALEPELMAAWVRNLQQDHLPRDVQARTLTTLRALHRMYRERDGAAEDFWGFAGGVEGWPALPPERWDQLADGVVAAGEVQRREVGQSKNLDSNIQKVEEALRRRDAAALVGVTLWKNAAFFPDPGEMPKRELDRKPIHDTLLKALEAVHRDLPALVAPYWQRRMEGLGRLVPRFDEAMTRMRQVGGRYGFEDMVHFLSAGGVLRGEMPGGLDAVHYRLDGAIQHILLDEFQDTSASQWSVLRPLVEEILSGYEGERALFVVADPKQSIYSWRGGEPAILDVLRAQPGMEVGALTVNRRSSPQILSLVNKVFPDLAQNPVFSQGSALPEDRRTAERWAEAFEPHTSRPEAPEGYVRIEVAPDEAHLRLRRAADLIESLHAEHPTRSIGVLTRTNKTGATLLATLRGRGLEASDEGGVPVVDSAPVQILLALLRVADHPADRVSAYLVAQSPLGPVVGLEAGRIAELRSMEGVARGLRRILLESGYGGAMAQWAEPLRPGASPRDQDRLDQFVALAYEWEPRATLRPTDFVRHAEAVRREAPAASRIRVMTIHRAKGLEFEIVVLPEVETSFLPGGGGEELPYRAEPGGPVTRVFPPIPGGLLPYFPQAAEAAGQLREARIRDGLSSLYVALTRAERALYLLLPAKVPGANAFSGARLLWNAAGLEGLWNPEAIESKKSLVVGATLLEMGEAGWDEAETKTTPILEAPEGGATTPILISLAPPTGRRNLPRMTPSGMEGGGTVALTTLLAPPHAARQRGTLVHAWFEGLEWLDDEEGGTPQSPFPGDPERLLAEARRIAPRLEAREVLALAEQFRRWVALPEVRAVLDRSRWPEGTEVAREARFLSRVPGGILAGSADRVLRIPARSAPPGSPRLVVVDWKTDRLDAGSGEKGVLESLMAHYRPQMEAYLEALSEAAALAPEEAEGRILFLEAGVSERVSHPRRSARGSSREGG